MPRTDSVPGEGADNASYRMCESPQMTATELHITGDEQADAGPAADPNGLPIGMVLDQHIRLPWTRCA